jgi:hypothetical protein
MFAPLGLSGGPLSLASYPLLAGRHHAINSGCLIFGIDTRSRLG